MNAMLIINLILLITLTVIIIVQNRIIREIKNPDAISKAIENIKNVKIENSLNPLVLEVYKAFISNPSVFSQETHHVKVKLPQGYIKIWSSNDIDSRNFDIVDDAVLNHLNISEKILNNLSFADKMILDKIVQKIKIDNRAFIDKIFIIK